MLLCFYVLYLIIKCENMRKYIENGTELTLEKCVRLALERARERERKGWD